MSLYHDIEQLAVRLEKEAAGYKNQIEEAQAAGLEHSCTLGLFTGLRQAAKELRATLANYDEPKK